MQNRIQTTYTSIFASRTSKDWKFFLLPSPLPQNLEKKSIPFIFKYHKIPTEFQKNSKRFPKEFQKNQQRISKTFPKYSRRIPKEFPRFCKYQTCEFSNFLYWFKYYVSKIVCGWVRMAKCLLTSAYMVGVWVRQDAYIIKNHWKTDFLKIAKGRKISKAIFLANNSSKKWTIFINIL